MLQMCLHFNKGLSGNMCGYDHEPKQTLLSYQYAILYLLVIAECTHASFLISHIVLLLDSLCHNDERVLFRGKAIWTEQSSRQSDAVRHMKLVDLSSIAALDRQKQTLESTSSTSGASDKALGAPSAVACGM